LEDPEIDTIGKKLGMNGTKPFVSHIIDNSDVESNEDECEDIYNTMFKYWDYLKKFKLTKNTLDIEGYSVVGSSTIYVSEGEPGIYVIASPPETCSWGENVMSEMKEFQDIIKRLSKTKKIDKNRVFYSVVEKAIYNDWFGFARSLFPDMRDMTKEEQKIWNELDNDISEIVEI